jgi:predicted Rossmann fold nucleotide-binding protein DprA/Smf involved in DNA uptake
VADFVDSTVKDIDRRLRELKGEVAKLEAARAALVGSRRPPRRAWRAGSSATASASPPASTRRRSRRGPGRPRGRRGGNTRGNQALELVRSRPGITIPEIAAELKIEPNYLYRVMPKLESDGHVKRDGLGWYPA